MYLLEQVLRQFLGSLGKNPELTVLLAVIGFVPIILWLFRTRHVSFEASASDHVIGCGDGRVWKKLVIFGGSASFSFGFEYFVLGLLFETLGLPILATLAFAAATLRFLLSMLNTLLFFVYLLIYRETFRHNISVRSHLQGCGWITASGLLFWTYWLQKITFFSWLVKIRDVETVVCFACSLPWFVVLNTMSLFIVRRFTIPSIRSVDNPHPRLNVPNAVSAGRLDHS